MSLIVEDGTGLSTSEGYLSVAEADAYHTKYDNAAWTGSTSTKEVAIKRATQYLEARFRLRWIGIKVNSVQALGWPRYDASDESGYPIRADRVPDAVKNACAEAALKSLTETLMPDVDEPGMISSESVTVGPISESKSYVAGKSQTKQYKLIDRMLAPLLESADRIERA